MQISSLGKRAGPAGFSFKIYVRERNFRWTEYYLLPTENFLSLTTSHLLVSTETVSRLRPGITG